MSYTLRAQAFVMPIYAIIGSDRGVFVEAEAPARPLRKTQVVEPHEIQTVKNTFPDFFCETILELNQSRLAMNRPPYMAVLFDDGVEVDGKFYMGYVFDSWIYPSTPE